MRRPASTADPEKVTGRVRALRALAARTPFLPEREACLAKSVELMRRHGLTEADVLPPSPSPRRPVPHPASWRVTVTVAEPQVTLRVYLTIR